MSVATKAIETTGTIDANRQLVLDDPPEDMYTVLNGKPFHDPGFGRFPDHGIAQVVNTLSAPHADDLGLSDSARVGRNIAANAG